MPSKRNPIARGAVGAVLGLALALTAAPAHAAPSAPPGPGLLTPLAQRTGLTAAGGGEMGWSALGPPSTLPGSVLAQLLQRGVPGVDVSRYQGSVDWRSSYAQGNRFAFVKATEGTYSTSTTFASQDAGARAAGLITGAYHFANPQDSSGAAQARFFVAHGGGWTPDGRTLPGVLDIEYDPYDHGECYGLSQPQMVAWIRDFTTTYQSLTGRAAIVYTTTDWWTTCTGDTPVFGWTNPLWIARFAADPGPLPAGWYRWTFWQYADTPLDQDLYAGTLARLRIFALAG